jgi:hypothetical protein
MSAAMINQQGVQSAEAREMMRMPLRELRKHQQIPLRRLEQRLALVMIAVLRVDDPSSPFLFEPSGWRIEFGDTQTPLDPVKETDLFIKQRAAGLDNTIAFLQRRRPGMSAEQALEQMIANVDVETARNQLMRPLQAISGSMGAAAPTENDSYLSPSGDEQIQ